jgi:uroporphyrinogen decarboxylase
MHTFHLLEETCIKPAPDFNRLSDVLWRRKKPDYVPFYELFVNMPVMESILGKKIPDRKATVEFYYRAGYDYVPVWPGCDFVQGSLIDRREGYPVNDRESFRKYSWPELSSITFAEFEDVAPILPEGMKIIGQTGGVFEILQGICGYENICFFLMDDRKLLSEILERIGALYEVIYTGMAQLESVGALVISDDLGYKTQTLISPQDLREFILPLHKKLVDIAHYHNKPCILHSCGNLSSIMDELIDDVGIDAKHSYEDIIMPVDAFAKKYKERVAILGGFDVNRLVCSSQEDIRGYTRFLLDNLGGFGGYALGSGNSIPDYVPVSNYLTMLDEGWRPRL